MGCWAVGHQTAGRGGIEAMVFVCLPMAPPLHIPTLCGSERVLVVSTEVLDDLSCLTTPGSAVPEVACCPSVDQVHTDAHSESMEGFLTPALACGRRCCGGGGGEGGGGAVVLVVSYLLHLSARFN